MAGNASKAAPGSVAQRIAAQERLVQDADAKIGKAKETIATQERVKARAAKMVEWLKAMPSEDEDETATPEPDEAPEPEVQESPDSDED